MKKKWVVLLVVLFLVSCNFPLLKKEEPTSIFELANQTMTAMFAGLPTPTRVTTAESTNAVATIVQTSPTVMPPISTVTDHQRSAQKVVAKYLSKKPVLDGDWGDWKKSTIAYAADYVVYGQKAWKDDADCEGSFIVGWDENFLYLGVKVKDDAYVQNAGAELLYRGDSIELLIDTDLNGDFYENKLSEDDYQIGISAGRGGIQGPKEAYLWYPISKKGSLSQQIDITSTSTAGIYRLEVQIPWSVFQITPQRGKQMGFEFSVSDNDDTDENVQQTLVSNLPTHAFLDPTTWGVIVLE